MGKISRSRAHITQTCWVGTSYSGPGVIPFLISSWLSESNPRFSSSDSLYGRIQLCIARIELILQPDGLEQVYKRFPMEENHRSRFDLKFFRFSFFPFVFPYISLHGDVSAMYGNVRKNKGKKRKAEKFQIKS